MNTEITFTFGMWVYIVALLSITCVASVVAALKR